MLAIHTSANACSCVDIVNLSNYALIESKLLKSPDLAIVHGRALVASVGDPVEIEIIRQFQGVPLTKIAPRRGDSAACGTTLGKNEEGVYFAFNGEVSLCGKFPADKRLLKSLANREDSAKNK